MKLRKLVDPPVPVVDATDVVHEVLVLMLVLELAEELEDKEVVDEDDDDVALEEEEEELWEELPPELLELEALEDVPELEWLDDPTLEVCPAIATK